MALPNIDLTITMIAVQTKYIPATNTRGSRIKAFTSSGQSLTIGFDYSLEDYQLYEKAAIMLCEKMGWSTKLIGGSTKDGYTFVFTK